MQSQVLSIDDKQRFLQDGYVVVPELLTQADAGLLKQVARMDRELASDRMSRADGEGGSVDLVVRNKLPEDNVYGAIVRHNRWWKRWKCCWTTKSIIIITR